MHEMTRYAVQISLAAMIVLTTSTVTVAQAGRSQMGHARARQLAALGRLPAVGDIVVADILNYHRHGIPLPKAGEDIALDLRWDVPDYMAGQPAVLQIGIATPRLHDKTHMKPLSVCLVIDCSGSMGEAGKMSRVKQGLLRFLQGLRRTDQVAIVTYSSEARVLLSLRRLGSRVEHRRAIRSLEPDGNTNLHAGLMLGYDQVGKHAETDTTRRVILLTDGIANSGVIDAATIARDSKAHNAKGVDLSTIGVGINFNRDLLATLAKSGRGLFHFVADDKDIKKVFVQELQSLVAPIARDVVLELRYSASLRLHSIFGARAKMGKNSCKIRLDDFNHGLTQVILVRFKARFKEDDSRRGKIKVRLSYRKEGLERRFDIKRSTRFLAAIDGKHVVDHEVRKNYVIALMARAMRKMAKDCERSRFADADQRLARALARVKHEYPATQDKDINRVRNILRGYRATLSKHIERFRRH